MLHNRRQRLKGIEEAESRGESFWTTSFDERARFKILHAIRDVVSALWRGTEFISAARDLILRDEGLMCLMDPTDTPEVDFQKYVLSAKDDMVPTVIEAIATAFSNPTLVNQSGAWNAYTDFAAVVNTVLREHRVSFELQGLEMIPFSSRELHVGVVSPTLQLLRDTRFAASETAYQSALGEIANGDPADAVTDAGTALQQMLVALGCRGNALGPLIKSARTKGLLAPHDSPMLDAVEKIMNWVSADRSETGDAHAVTTPSASDAWFIVHIVGALMLRLSAGGQRSGA
jgi:hypothetical protein